MKITSVSILIVAILGALAHVAGAWIVHSQQTAGFAVALRNRGYLSPDMAHAFGLSAHVAGFLLSVFVGLGAVSVLRDAQSRLCLGLAIGISIPIVSPMFGLAFPLGIFAIIAQQRAGRKVRRPAESP